MNEQYCDKLNSLYVEIMKIRSYYHEVRWCLLINCGFNAVIIRYFLFFYLFITY